jgi:hypothetical protein
MEDSSVKSFDRRPTWLLNDINELMLERNGKLLFAEISSSNTLMRRPADKSHLYKNYVREKTSTFKSGDVIQIKLKQSKSQGHGLVDSSSEKKISNFVEKLRHERQRQREHREAFMRHAIDPPDINPIVKNRMVQPRPLSAGTSPPPLPKTERPKTAPSQKERLDGRSSNNRPESVTFNKTKSQRSPPHGRSRDRIGQNPGTLLSPPTDPLPKVQERLLALVKIVQFLQNSKQALLHLKAEENGKAIFATKIQRNFRDFVLRRQAYHKAVMPSVFMRFLKSFQKRSAAKKIIIFLREFSTIHSHLIVKRFMVCVRKAQIFIREILRVKRARTQLIVLYWEKIEKSYRKQIEDQERETFARLQRERMARITAGNTSDVHGRWGVTHKQVVTLFGHMDTVDMRRANFLREIGSSSRSSRLRHTSMSSKTLTSTVMSDTVETKYRQRIIEKYVSYKRCLHLKKGAAMSPHVSRATSPQPGEGADLFGFQSFTDDSLNIRLIKKFIHEPSVHIHLGSGLGIKSDDEGVRTNRELLERQLAPAGVVVEDDHGMGRKRKAAMRIFRRKPFLCLTDASLGKPWKQIIEEVVREDIVRKKRILQEKNRKTFQDRVAEEKKRGIPIPTFTSSTGRRGTEHSSPVFGLVNRVHDSVTEVDQRDKREDDAFSSSSSPQSSCSQRGRNGNQLSTSPALSRDYSRTREGREVSPRLPSL